MTLIFLLPTISARADGGEPALVGGYYQISTADQLLWFANYVNNGNTEANAQLKNNIILNAYLLEAIEKGETEDLVTWIPIGTPENPYKGIFNTNYSIISGLYVNNPAQDYVGLFGYYAGGDDYYSFCVLDSYFAGNNYVGGIAGYTESEIPSSFFVGKIAGNNNKGAIIGGVDNTKQLSFRKCYYNTDLCTLGAINGEDDEENDVVGKPATTFHSGEIANSFGIRQDLSNPNSYPNNFGAPVHKNLDGNGYHNPEYEEGHCKYCINYTYSLPQLVDGVYQISTADELYGFMHLVNTGNNYANAVLTADIVVNENVLEKVHAGTTEGLREWYSIGNDGDYGYLDINGSFYGYFDGQYHTISGLYFDSNLGGNSQVGLFNCVYNTVKNVILMDTYFKNNQSCGGISKSIEDCGMDSKGQIVSNYTNQIIENCIFKGEITGIWSAGICSFAISANGDIKNCINFGKINGMYFSGGILGADYSQGCSVVNCYNAGEIVCTEPNNNLGSSVSGICGGATVRSISNCYNTGKVTTGYGIYGTHWGAVNITNAYNNQDVCSDYMYNCYGDNITGGGNTTTATLCNGTLPEGFSSDDWIAGKTETKYGKIVYTYPHLKVFDGKYPAYTIEEKLPTAIEIKTPPTQTEYALGENYVQTSGAVVTFKYSDNTEIDVDFDALYKTVDIESKLKEGLDFSDFDHTTTGKKTITVTYNDLSTQFDITVVDKGNCGYQYLDEDGTLTFYYGEYKNGAGYIGENGCSKPFDAEMVKKAVFDPSFKDFKPTNLTNMLSFCPNLQVIVDMDKYLNTEDVTSMHFMFAYCPLEMLDLSTFDTRNVENMFGMFWGKTGESNLKTIYVGDKWSTENVTESILMFYDSPLLVGGKGTTYDANFTDLTYARIDGGKSAPGYFTYKGVVTPVDTTFTAPEKLSYIEGEELDLTGGAITIKFNNLDKQNIALTDAAITLSAFDNTLIGEQVISVLYNGVKVGEFTVSVAKPEPKPENPYTQPEVKENVYQISSAEELLYFMFDVNNGNGTANAILTQDIVVNADLFKQIADLLKRTTKAGNALNEWIPIGTAENPFRGTFDGNGHIISGIYIKDETQSNVGLFGNVGSEAVIKNLGVTDSYISGNENVGAICGKSEGTIVNCYTVSEVVGNKNVNPLVGAKETAAVVENCYYLAEESNPDDPCAKTAEQFKSGEVAAQLAKGATINGVTYSGESFEGLTELPGTEDIEVIPEPEPEPENPPTPVSEMASNSNINVWSYNHTIFISNAPDSEYRIIDLNGRLITTSTTKSTREVIRINKSGVLIVIIGTQSFKVTL